jgi:hypothetical protein
MLPTGNAITEPDRGRFSNSGRFVAHPDRAAFFEDYFRIGGNPAGTDAFAPCPCTAYSLGACHGHGIYTILRENAHVRRIPC